LAALASILATKNAAHLVSATDRTALLRNRASITPAISGIVSIFTAGTENPNNSKLGPVSLPPEISATVDVARYPIAIIPAMSSNARADRRATIAIQTALSKTVIKAKLSFIAFNTSKS
jgi:hypothetical protein